ncbi:kin of IRRE-like protein 1 [Teleopsis dalmanni]|uniref:kin of IRRE-like protein 1 n=1 Tax=Teleopsis dalmanni TaxID=139649 RepID=UPI0018CEE214|nr:kin of IRRE-like protein 1 [Teleopsis dalmanni]
MILRPLIVRLKGENHPLSADNSYQLSCVVIGSRPAPTITWWKGSTAMKNTHEIANPDGNMTTSILTFTPTIDDRGKFLSCRAEQSMIPESGKEDGWKLDIYHIPVVSLELGTNSMNSSLREGIDVFFECNIKSNPWIYKVSWRHNPNRTYYLEDPEGFCLKWCEAIETMHSLVFKNIATPAQTNSSAMSTTSNTTRSGSTSLKASSSN